MHLVTGHAGIEHIKPSDDGAFNAGVVGTGKYVFDLGNKFEYEIVSNNLVKIKDGELINQGRHSRIPVNNYEEVTIENGLQGVKRYDLICARYTKNADTSIESADLVVVKGTSSTNPSDPVYEEGNILEDALVDDFPLYRVRLDGLNIVGVDCLFEVIPSVESVYKDVVAIKENLDKNGTVARCTALTNTVPSSTKTAVASVVIPEDGVYAITVGVRWAGNATGLRSLLVYGSETPYYDLSAYNDSDTTHAMESRSFVQRYTIVWKYNKGDVAYLWAWQNSGTSLTVDGHNMSAVRIG